MEAANSPIVIEAAFAAAVAKGAVAIRYLGNLETLRRAWGIWGPWMGLTPEDSPMFLGDVGSQEVYSLQLREH